VIFATEPDGSFGSGVKSWHVPDLERIERVIRSAGYSTLRLRIDRLLSLEAGEGDLVIYTSANSSELRRYTQDILYFVRQRVRIAPSYELLIAHENKGIQEIIKKIKGFGNLPGDYDVDFDERSAAPPYVFKLATGAGSSGVVLVKDGPDEKQVRRRFFSHSLGRRLKLLQRRFVLSPADFRRYAYYYKPFRPYVTQPFIEGLAGDFKVLIFGERYYTLARGNRPNDFRASGSGRFDFNSPCPPEVLHFARDVGGHFDTPFLSLDVAKSDRGCHLLEFQALNFGPLTLVGSNGYYVEDADGWRRVSEKGDLEGAYSHAVVHYIKRLNAASAAK
jgi:hypothetical protein